MTASKVYFSDMRTGPESANLPQKLHNLMKAAGFEGISFDGKFTAVKMNFGEPGNLAFLRPNWAKVVCDYVKQLGGLPYLTDSNTLYVGGRRNGLEHLESAYANGFNPFQTGVHTIIADGIKGSDEVCIPVEGGEYVKEAKIGRAIADADVVISLSHFKGHELTGFGGAIKQLAIGCASAKGKALIHSAGVTNDRFECWQKHADKTAFPEAMADAASSIYRHFEGKIAFVNVMKNLSVDCDCCAVAEDPCMADIGILASLDPVAIDQACMDLVMGSDDPGKEHFMGRVNSRNGIHTIEAAAELGFGTREYELIEL